MSDMELDEPVIINVARPSTNVDSHKENLKACFFLQMPFGLFGNNLNRSLRNGLLRRKEEFLHSPPKKTQNPDSKPKDIQQPAPMVTESPLFFLPFN